MEKMVEVIKKEISFTSTQKDVMCKGYIWEPKSLEPKKIIQLIHGMVEHIDRYDQVAKILCSQGFIVVGIDHVGHGRSCNARQDLGVYPRKKGADILIEDQHKLRELTKNLYGSDLPYFMLGHSMGSFVLRCYLARHGEGLSGAVIVGTGYQSPVNIFAGKTLCAILCALKGEDFRSKFVDDLGCGGYNQQFQEDGCCGREWLSANDDNVQAYCTDELCGWMFSVSGYYVISNLLAEAQSTSALLKVPEDLPIFIISGAQDPVGDNGEGPARVFQDYKKAGCTNVVFDLVKGCRHEILNEKNRDDILGELISWMNLQTA